MVVDVGNGNSSFNRRGCYTGDFTIILDLKEQLKEKAAELGFDACGVTSIAPELRRDYYLNWIQEGKHGEMGWMERNNERRLAPSNILPEARSIICLGLNYYQPEPDRRGVIAKYALGKDYHDVFFKKLKQLCTWLREQGGENKPYVDTGPVLEKPIAHQAGLGWQGKSTILIHPREGTWLFLGEIITTLEFAPDKPMKEHCGSCTRCVDACPTGAITGPYQLDSRKCISYLTIEHKGGIPVEYRRAIGDRLYGCDICLDVCPWNKWAVKTKEAKFEARAYPDLREMADWDDEDFAEIFAGSPIKRIKLTRWLRNVAIVLGNIGTEEDLETLEKIARKGDEMLSEHAEWAINEIKTRKNFA